MEKLISNITKLIAQHNCVILPGVGAFLAHKVPACYNAAEKVFMPPHRFLAFNPQVTVDDALLISEYMGGGNVSYERAGELLAADIEEFRSALSSKGVVRFGGLGSFSMDIDGKIAFEASENGIDDPYNYGFEPLAIPLLSDLKQKDIVIKRRSIGKYVSAVAAAIILLFLVVPLGNSIYQSNTNLSVAGFTPKEKAATPSVPSAEIIDDAEEAQYTIAPVDENVAVTETDDVVAASELLTEPASVETAVETAEVADAVEEVPVERFSIIVASTPNPKNAELAITELSRKMKADYSVVEGDRRFRIAIESYDNNDDATIALERIQATFPDAWIYIHK